jgi:hypothetical protein
MYSYIHSIVSSIDESLGASIDSKSSLAMPDGESASSLSGRESVEAAVQRFGPMRALVLCRALGLVNKHIAIAQKEALLRWRAVTYFRRGANEEHSPAVTIGESLTTGDNNSAIDAEPASEIVDEEILPNDIESSVSDVDYQFGAISRSEAPSILVANKMLRALMLMIECRFDYKRHKKQSAMHTWYRNTRLDGEADIIGTTPVTMDLSTQNERLKGKIQSLLIQITSQHVFSHLSPSAKFVIGARYLRAWIRSKQTSPQFKAFEKWKISTQILALSASMRAQSVKVTIGMQHVEIEKEAIKMVRTENANLMNMLMCSLYFLKWKMRKTMMDLFEERKLRYEERRIVSQRMEAVRSSLVAAHQLERKALAAAVQRGTDFCGKLKSVQDNLESSLHTPN